MIDKIAPGSMKRDSPKVQTRLGKLGETFKQLPQAIKHNPSILVTGAQVGAGAIGTVAAGLYGSHLGAGAAAALAVLQGFQTGIDVQKGLQKARKKKNQDVELAGFGSRRNKRDLEGTLELLFEERGLDPEWESVDTLLVACVLEIAFPKDCTSRSMIV